MNDITTIGVLGAGTMGAGIAQVAAEAGLDVIVHDPVEGATERARRRIQGFLERKVAKDQLTEELALAAAAWIQSGSSLEALAVADLVVEAILEEIELKRDAFRRLDAVTEVSTILATNTSSLSVARIAAAASDPGRVVGMHFFNPVPLMALVEVVPASLTAIEVVDAVALLARRLGKTPVVAADTPGFIVNRVQRAFYLEAYRILEEGAAEIEAIDDAMRGIGFRLGLFELADVVGTDVNLAAGIAIFEGFFDDPRYRPAQVQRRVVDGAPRAQGRGRLLRLRGRGRARVVLASAGAVGPRRRLDAAQIEARILAAIVNEAASAVADGVATPEAIDTAMRLGTNWPDGPSPGASESACRQWFCSTRSMRPCRTAAIGFVPLLRSLADGGSFFAHQG